MSQQELATRAGMSAHGVSDPERGARVRTPATVRSSSVALGACSLHAERLLRACSWLTVVETSRERLQVKGETEWRVGRRHSPCARSFRCQ
jgi:predicted ATPase